MTWAGKINFVLISVVIILTVIAYGAVHQPVIALFYVLVAAMAILWAADGLLSGDIRYDRSWLQVPVYGAALYGFVQVIPFGTLASSVGLEGIPRTISVDPFSTQVAAMHFLALGIFFSVTLASLDSAKRIRRLEAIITVFGFAYAFFAILQSVLSPDKIYGIYERAFASPFGSFVNRHNFAAYMEMTLSLPLGLLFAGAVRKDKRLLYITAGAIMGSALLLSGSRGGLVAMLAQVVLLLILTTRSRGPKTVMIRTALAAVLLLAVVGGAIFVGGETSLTRIAETASSKDISTNRMHIWEVSSKVAMNSLPFGAGLGALGVAYTRYDTYNGLERVEQAHNDYLQALTDAGVIGLLLGGFFLVVLFRTAIRNLRTENLYRRGIVLGAFSGCFAIFVHSLFDFVLHTTAISLLFLTLAALVVAAGRKYNDDRDENIDHGHRKRRSGSVTFIGAGKHRRPAR